MMCEYVNKLQGEIDLLTKNESRFQLALKDERIKRSELMIGVVELKNRIEQLESFMDSIGACYDCCCDPCRCDKHIVIPD